MSTILILGAASDVAMACARRFAARKEKLILAARNVDRLGPFSRDLEIRYGVKVYLCSFEASEFASHAAFVDSLPETPDVTICAFGYLGDQAVAEVDFSEALKIIHVNYTGAVSILNLISDLYYRIGRGVIVGISSVAGERGRVSNYIYGSAKAGFSVYLSGLRNRLYHKGLHVMTVKPGFIETKMTAHLTLPKRLTASPSEVADAVILGIDRKRNVIYVKSIWRWIMLIIKNIPEFVFKKMRL